MKLIEFYKSLPVTLEQDLITFGYLDGVQLAAPESFWRYLFADTSDVINGCGAGGIGDLFVPDTIYAMSVKPACMIHDWMFTIYNDEVAFHMSNQVFFDNMCRISYARTKNKMLKWLRYRRILKYYKAVEMFGRQHFYDAHVGLYEKNTAYVKQEVKS